MNRPLTLKTEQEWSSGKGTCFPSPGEWGPVLLIMAFIGRLRLKVLPFSCFRYEMVRVCCWFSAWLREVFIWVPRFPLSPKTNLSKFQFHPEHTDTYKFLATSKCSLGKQITNYQFICLFFFFTDTLLTSELTLPFDVKI